SYRQRPSKTLCIMASVSEAADCQGSKLSGSEPVFMRTKVCSPSVEVELLSAAEEVELSELPAAEEPEAALEELPVSLPQPAKAVSIKARASTRLTRRFCIVTFLLRFTKNSLARIHTTFFK